MPELRDDAELLSAKVTLMRGGTSKGVFFNEADLPLDRFQREAFILSALGSPDPRQIDGIGGADILTSKVCVIGPGRAFDADVTYEFIQVGIDKPTLGYGANCGNLSSAVGAYAIEAGFVRASDPETTVRIYNTNTRQILTAIVPTLNGMPRVRGSFAISGVPGYGAEVRMDYSRTIGASTGALLPTGNLRDTLYVPELGEHVEMSIVDIGKAACFFRAEVVGIKGTEGPAGLSQEQMNRFLAIRKVAAVASGLPEDSSFPSAVAVIPATDYQTELTKAPIRAEDVSFVARQVAGPPPSLHKAYASTTAICTAAAAVLPGTVLAGLSSPIHGDVVKIGHPSGVFPVRISIAADGTVREASYSRTARKLLEGQVFVHRHSREQPL
ncbi:PrpF domain-containing protein [Hoeflea sp. BAL378]|uniref:PrpF domain-containing protein n=1 Tax=Hoeflea sp. BAL378 TaxID=1547437 RepID=UPI000A91BB6F|nr:PrpF domain-containing protein [Hoeflea sp. BAL378]